MIKKTYAANADFRKFFIIFFDFPSTYLLIITFLMLSELIGVDAEHIAGSNKHNLDIGGDVQVATERLERIVSDELR